METEQQTKSSIIAIAKKRLERIELRFKDLELEIMGLKQFLDGLSEEKAPERREPVPENIPEKYTEKLAEKPAERPKLLKKKKESKPEPVAPREPEKPLHLEKDAPEAETITFETQLQQPKPTKPPLETEIQLDGVDLRFLKLIASQEEGEHQLPFIAEQLNLTQARVQEVISKLIDTGLLYSPNPIDPNAEFYIDQKGLEALAKKGLL